MQTIAIIGCGAIGEAVAGYLADHEGVVIGAAIINPGKDSRARELFGEDVEIAHTVCVPRRNVEYQTVGQAAGVRQILAGVTRPGRWIRAATNAGTDRRRENNDSRRL